MGAAIRPGLPEIQFELSILTKFLLCGPLMAAIADAA
jgi:hypothetical protein